MKLIADGIILSLFWVLAIYIRKKENIEKLSWFSKKTPLYKKMRLVATIMISLVILLDGLLFFQPESLFLLRIRNILSLPLITHGFYLANIWIVYEIISRAMKYKLQNNKDFTPSKVHIFTLGISLVTISFIEIIYFIQHFIWGGFSYAYSSIGVIKGGYEILYGSLLIVLPAVATLVFSIRYMKEMGGSSKEIKGQLYLALFVALTQPILTKVTLIVEGIDILLNQICNKFNIGYHENSDDLLLAQSTVLRGSSIARLNVYFLYGFLITIGLLWAGQASPFIPEQSLYMHGERVSVYFAISFFAFWMLERLSRLVKKYGDIVRFFYIPIAIFTFIYPFFTESVYLSNAIVISGYQSIYHIMANALGENKHIFFVCIIVLQICVGYLTYILTGTAGEKKNFYAILPLLFVSQMLLAVISFPILVALPPYYLKEKSLFIISGHLVVIGILIFFIGYMASKLFHYNKIRWSVPVSPFWKNKIRLYSVLSIITLFIFLPVILKSLYAIQNYQVNAKWSQHYKLQHNQIIVDTTITNDYKNLVMMTKEKDTNHSDVTHLIGINIEEQIKAWEIILPYKMNTMLDMEDDHLLLKKSGDKGFIIVDKKTGRRVHEYIVKDPKSKEFLNFEYNERAVLITDDIRQFVFDLELGEIELELIGNNFYSLLPGNQLALIRNSKVYKYNEERWDAIKTLDPVGIEPYYYYDEHGLIIFTKDAIVKYNADLDGLVNQIYTMGSRKLTTMNEQFYQRVGDKVIFYVYDNNTYYGYIMNTKDFTYENVLLEQKIKGFHDNQNIVVDKESERYILYDDYQLSVFEKGSLMSRQWYNLPVSDKGTKQVALNTTAPPIFLEDQIVWIDNSGTIRCITY